mmetsp:Transcript_23302/g.34988  ORF Transcript_23302/g.34988 Transcript_23302/m.34988 type:complete len:134 (-) Transcript_23302:1495-1896(-)
MDPRVQAAGMKIGIDISSLYEKYKNRTIFPSAESKSQTLGEKTNVIAESSLLDTAIVCQRCHGTGLCKVSYNHQVREVNCDDCDAEGLLERNRGIAGASFRPLRPFKVSDTSATLKGDTGMENGHSESSPRSV